MDQVPGAVPFPGCRMTVRAPSCPNGCGKTGTFAVCRIFSYRAYTLHSIILHYYCNFKSFFAETAKNYKIPSIVKKISLKLYILRVMTFIGRCWKYDTKIYTKCAWIFVTNPEIIVMFDWGIDIRGKVSIIKYMNKCSCVRLKRTGY